MGWLADQVLGLVRARLAEQNQVFATQICAIHEGFGRLRADLALADYLGFVAEIHGHALIEDIK
jgi:hypothetical protein